MASLQCTIQIPASSSPPCGGSAAAIRNAFLGAVEKLAVEERVEFLPLRRLWNEYLAAQQHDVTWFMRDVTHANVRGAQVVARLLESYFAPK